MPMIDDLEPVLAAPAEALNVEFKGWLDLRGNDEHKAVLGKAAIALFKRSPRGLRRPSHVEERYCGRHDPTARLLRPQARP